MSKKIEIDNADCNAVAGSIRLLAAELCTATQEADDLALRKSRLAIRCKTIQERLNALQVLLEKMNGAGS